MNQDITPHYLPARHEPAPGGKTRPYPQALLQRALWEQAAVLALESVLSSQ